MITKKKLKNELKNLRYVTEFQRKQILELQKQVGYLFCYSGSRGYIKPSISIVNKVDMLLNHLGLDILFQSERVRLIEKEKKKK